MFNNYWNDIRNIVRKKQSNWSYIKESLFFVLLSDMFPITSASLALIVLLLAVEIKGTLQKMPPLKKDEKHGRM